MCSSDLAIAGEVKSPLLLAIRRKQPMLVPSVVLTTSRKAQTNRALRLHRDWFNIRPANRYRRRKAILKKLIDMPISVLKAAAAVVGQYQQPQFSQCPRRVPTIRSALVANDRGLQSTMVYLRERGFRTSYAELNRVRLTLCGKASRARGKARRKTKRIRRIRKAAKQKASHARAKRRRRDQMLSADDPVGHATPTTERPPRTRFDDVPGLPWPIGRRIMEVQTDKEIRFPIARILNAVCRAHVRGMYLRHGVRPISEDPGFLAIKEAVLPKLFRTAVLTPTGWDRRGCLSVESVWRVLRLRYILVDHVMLPVDRNQRPSSWSEIVQLWNQDLASLGRAPGWRDSASTDRKSVV